MSTLRCLLLDHTSLEHDPLVYSLGGALARQGVSVEAIGYRTLNTPEVQVVPPSLILRRVDRGFFHGLPRPIRGGLRFLRYFHAIKRLASRFRPDVVVAFNYDTLAVGATLKRARLTSRLVYYCTEYSPAPSAGDYWRGWGIVKRLEGLSLAHADRLASVDEYRAEIQSREWGRPIDFVIANAPLHQETIEQEARQLIAACLSCPRPLRVVYAGGIHEHTGVLELLEAVNGLAPRIELQIFGHVAHSVRAAFERRLTDSKGLAIYGGVLDYRLLPQALLGNDVGVVAYRNKKQNTALCAPAKLFEYLRCGLAVLTTGQPGPRKVIEASKAGLVVRELSEASIGEALLSLERERSTLEGMRWAALRAFRESYSYQIQAADLLTWITAR